MEQIEKTLYTAKEVGQLVGKSDETIRRQLRKYQNNELKGHIFKKGKAECVDKEGKEFLISLYDVHFNLLDSAETTQRMMELETLLDEANKKTEEYRSKYKKKLKIQIMRLIRQNIS